MNAPIPSPLRSLCRKYCDAYGLKFEDLFLADTRSERCYRQRGRGRPPKATYYPALILSQTMDFLLLASQRKTDLSIDRIATELGLDEWDALERTATAESRLAADEVFAVQFEKFLDGLDDGRKQACTVKDTREMTFDEIGAALDPPVSWQRAQQIYNRALKKLRRNPEALQTLTELMR